jgi:hypothetical protein
MVDGFQQWFEVGGGPWLRGGRHQDQRQTRPVQSLAEQAIKTCVFHLEDALFDRTSDRRDVIDQGSDHRLRVRAQQVGEQDDPDPGARERIAADVAGERVVDGFARGHSCSRIEPSSGPGLAGEPAPDILSKRFLKPLGDGTGPP